MIGTVSMRPGSANPLFQGRIISKEPAIYRGPPDWTVQYVEKAVVRIGSNTFAEGYLVKTILERPKE